MGLMHMSAKSQILLPIKKITNPTTAGNVSKPEVRCVKIITNKNTRGSPRTLIWVMVSAANLAVPTSIAKMAELLSAVSQFYSKNLESKTMKHKHIRIF